MASRDKKPCPICNKSTSTDRRQNPYAPFCSERCRTIDLGRWLTERYRISSPANESEVSEPEAGGDEMPGENSL